MPAPRVFGRLVPERSDDFAWENDRVAYRVYGQRLENGLVSSGIDVWCKRTPALIIDKWYRHGDYHKTPKKQHLQNIPAQHSRSF